MSNKDIRANVTEASRRNVTSILILYVIFSRAMTSDMVFMTGGGLVGLGDDRGKYERYQQASQFLLPQTEMQVL
jgi:hypothetical protein